MTQNIYDDEAFFAAYSRLPRSVDGLASAPEWPSLRALLPDLRGRAVVDLGCGYGWFCRWAAAAGAARVLGLDVSERMLGRARNMTGAAPITYRRADLESVELPARAFDLAYSSLALHYIEHLPKLFATVHEAVVPGGRFVFSVEHPIFTAPAEPGWSTDSTGRPTWPVNRYLEEGPRTRNWLTDGVIKQYRTVATYVNTLQAAGFALTHLDEWGPSHAQIAEIPELAKERERPAFLIVAAANLE